MFKNSDRVYGVTAEEKMIVIYENDCLTGDVIVYDGIEKRKMDFNDFRESKSKYFTSPFKFIRKDDDKTLEETREELLRDNEIIKKATKGFINFQKQGGSVQAALSVFEYFRDPSHKAEPILVDESEYFRHGTFGAICFAEEYQGRGFKYDFTSHYPAIMKSETFFIPFKKGTEVTITEPIHKIAIYHCVIGKSSDENIQKLFRWNRKNLYPYDDVLRAQELGLKVTITKCMFWTQDECIRGDKLFGKFVDYMFDLKKKKIPRAKHIFNCLAGKLMAKDFLKVKLHNDVDAEAIYPGRSMLTFYPFGEDHHIFELVRNNSMYQSVKG